MLTKEQKCLLMETYGDLDYSPDKKIWTMTHVSEGVSWYMHYETILQMHSHVEHIMWCSVIEITR